MLRTLKEKTAGRKTLIVLLLVGLMIGSATAGMVFFFTLEEDTEYVEPMTGQNKSTVFVADIGPGQSTSSEFAYSSTNTETYSIAVELFAFNDTDGTSGLEAARNDTVGTYVSRLELGGDNYTHDLLNDGYAQYDYFSDSATGNITVAALEDTRTSAGTQNVSVKLGLARATEAPPDGPVPMHANFSHNCASCHSDMSKFEDQHNPGTITVTSVHAGLNATDCQSCHGRSKMDIHMDCTAACHEEGFPDATVESHDDLSHTRNDFTCSDGTTCHASDNERSIAYTHQQQGVYMCESCHSEATNNWTINTDDKSTDVMDAHTWGSESKFEDCDSCHGIDETGMHAQFVSSDCSKCHDSVS